MLVAVTHSRVCVYFQFACHIHALPFHFYDSGIFGRYVRCSSGCIYVVRLVHPMDSLSNERKSHATECNIKPSDDGEAPRFIRSEQPLAIVRPIYGEHKEFTNSITTNHHRPFAERLFYFSECGAHRRRIAGKLSLQLSSVHLAERRCHFTAKSRNF